MNGMMANAAGPRIAMLRIRLRLTWASVRRDWAVFRRSKAGLTGLAIMGLYFLLMAAYPVASHTVWSSRVYDPVIGYDPRETQQPAPPSTRHWLGTDPLGRDVLSQLMASTRSEFVLGVFAALVTVVVATFVGAASAYFGGWIDAVLMRFADLMLMLPMISVLLVLSAFMNVGMLELGIIIGLLGGFGGVGIVLKSQALKLKVQPFIEAARIAGAGPFFVIRSHIVPGLIPFSLLYMMFTVSAAIFSEAILSYLGLMSVQTSWGAMLNVTQSRGYMQFDAYWWLVFPASLSVTLLSASFYLVGRALDEVVNPRLRSQ